MARKDVFADEAGNFDFRRGGGATRYLVLTTVTLDDCSVGTELLTLRRQMAMEGIVLPGAAVHATEDRQAVRNRVFSVLSSAPLRVDATLFEKSKTQPQVVRRSADYVYKLLWFSHLKHVAPQIASRGDELLVVGASFGTRKRQAGLRDAISDVVSQTAATFQWETGFWPAASDPCLQAADYCCWAIQRKWEQGDPRSFDLIRSQVVTEYDFFQHGSRHYY